VIGVEASGPGELDVEDECQPRRLLLVLDIMSSSGIGGDPYPQAGGAP
jgi:hypothetical protein